MPLSVTISLTILTAILAFAGLACIGIAIHSVAKQIDRHMYGLPVEGDRLIACAFFTFVAIMTFAITTLFAGMLYDF